MSCCVPTVVLFFPSLGLRAPETICSERKDGSKDNSIHNNKKARIIDDQKKKIDEKKLLEMQTKRQLFLFPPEKKKSDIQFPTVFYLCIPTAWGSEGKYTDAESIGPRRGNRLKYTQCGILSDM